MSQQNKVNSNLTLTSVLKSIALTIYNSLILTITQYNND